MTIPLITQESLCEIDACDRGAALLASPACPPLPLALDVALALMAQHISTPEYAGLAPTMAGTARWLCAKMMLTADCTPAEVLAMHQPRLGIFATDERRQTLLCDAETLTLVAGTSHLTAPLSLVLGSDAHVQLHGDVTATAQATFRSGAAASVALVHPSASVLTNGCLKPEEGVEVITWHPSYGWWKCDGITPAPY